MMLVTCPCQSGNTYEDCCQTLHHYTQTAGNAEQLMRSRYSAFVLQNIDYIVATTVPFEQASLDKKAISDWAKNTDWAGLTILTHHPKLGKRHAQVEFKAFFNTDDGQMAHHERSTFVKVGNGNDTRWYFLDPTVPIHISQKQPCPCGSGEKYKRCCGQYLYTNI